MQVLNIRLSDFRNFKTLELSPKNVINVFIGSNAQGKTNLLESIHFASLGRSQRAVKEVDLIRWDQDQAIIRLLFQKLGVEQSIAFELSKNKSRRIILNDHPIRIKQLIGKFNTVLFAPEDLFLIKGSPANRRKFLDAEISQASLVYFADLLNYNKILMQRNSLLKLIKDGQAKSDNLALWNEQLVNVAIKLIKKRMEAIVKINRLASSLQRKITSDQEELFIEYEIHGAEDKNVLQDNLSNWYADKMSQNQHFDIIRGATTFGPHLDDLKLFINGHDLRLFGSQGQQRTAVLVLKLSEVEFLKEETGDYPILLLDDVMSELDSKRRAELLKFLDQQQIQTFITATDSAYFPEGTTADFFKVHSGTLQNEVR